MGTSADPRVGQEVPADSSALGHAGEVMVVSPDDLAGEIREAVAGSGRGRLDHIAVVEEGRYRGMLLAGDLITAAAESTAGDLVVATIPQVEPELDQELVVARAIESGHDTVAIVGDDGRYRGVISGSSLLAILAEEHREDMARLSGFAHARQAAVALSGEGLRRRFIHRFPWLLLGLVAAMAAAWILSGFETGLQSRVELAFFIPGIVYLADAVGTQTETLLVRGLSVGVSVRSVVRSELLTGLTLGIVLACIAFPGVALWVGPEVGMTVALSILAAAAMASGVAMVLPWALTRFGVDPAFGSGPVATVVQDLLSLAIYFGLASALVL